MKNELILDEKAVVPGRKYDPDKPWSCKFCYFWGGKRKGCESKQCYYLLPEEKVKKNDNSRCSSCPYGKHEPCIGYCMDQLQKEMKENTRKLKQGAVLLALMAPTRV